MPITITSDASSAQMGCLIAYYNYDWHFIYTDRLQQKTKINSVVNGNSWNLQFDNFSNFQNAISNNSTTASVIMTHCV